MEMLSPSANDLMKVVQLTAMNVQGISQQMGILTTAVQDLQTDMTSVKDRMQNYEDELRITRSQGKALKKSILNRVSVLLNISFVNGHVADECIETDQKYRGGFISRCYVDAKQSGLMAECYWETARRDYDRCIEFIEAWVPNVKGGVNGYKEYLDIRRQEREARKAEG